MTGLSSVKAAERLRRGEGNRAVSASSRTYGRILRTNVFNLYNTILFVIGAALLALGRYSDAVISVSIGLLNAVISAAQLRPGGRHDRSADGAVHVRFAGLDPANPLPRTTGPRLRVLDATEP